MMALTHEMFSGPDPDTRSHDEIIGYDENGLPTWLFSMLQRRWRSCWKNPEETYLRVIKMAGEHYSFSGQLSGNRWLRSTTRSTFPEAARSPAGAPKHWGVPITPSQARIATAAYTRFGKGRHPAGLNICDCFAYALAKEQNAALLFKGDDFAKTDIKPALWFTQIRIVLQGDIWVR